MFSSASELPLFTPSTGHTYFLPASKSLTPGIGSQTTQASKETTPMPGTQDTSFSGKSLLASKLTSDSDDQSLPLLMESYRLSVRYGKEYMDDNPIVGEPGSFILSKSRELTAPPAVIQAAPKAAASSSTITKRPPAPEIKTANLPSSARKGSKGAEKSPVSPANKDRKARRKSKAANGSATAETGLGIGVANVSNWANRITYEVIFSRIHDEYGIWSLE